MHLSVYLSNIISSIVFLEMHLVRYILKRHCKIKKKNYYKPYQNCPPKTPCKHNHLHFSVAEEEVIRSCKVVLLFLLQPFQYLKCCCMELNVLVSVTSG